MARIGAKGVAAMLTAEAEASYVRQESKYRVVQATSVQEGVDRLGQDVAGHCW